jgi:hypothetical protein
MQRGIGSHQLNHPAGRAADALLLVLWRCLEMTADSDSPERAETGRQLMHQILGAIETGIHNGWGGIELRYAVGAYLFVLERAEPDWIENNLDALLPTLGDPASPGAWRAFWHGYLWSRPIYNRLLISLREQYSELIRELSDLNSILQIHVEAQKRLSEHIVIGAIRQLEGFGFDELLGHLTANATDELRAHIAWFLWREISDARNREGPDWFDRLWCFMDEYWRRRVETWKAQPEQLAAREAGFLTHWLPLVPVTPRSAEERISLLLQRLDRHHDLEHVIEWLRSFGETECEAVSRLLDKLVKHLISGSEYVWLPNNLEDLLRELWATNNPDARQVVRETVADLLREYQIDFRSILDSG